MKEKDNYSALWQKKRNQWRVNGDANADWLQMRSVLDNHLPSSGLIKKPYNPGGLKWMYKFFIGLSITASISGIAYLSLSKKQHDPSRNVSVKESHIEPAPAIQNSKAVIIKDSGSINGKDRVETAKSGASVGLSPHPKARQTGALLVKDSLKKKSEDITSDESSHRDSTFSPITQTPPRLGVDTIGNINKPSKPVNLNNKAIQKTASDSTKQAKKRKRSKIGVFF